MSGEQGRRLYLLGGVRIVDEERDGVPRFRSQLTRALLGYLVVAARPVSRVLLADRFWPELAQGVARANLRRELHNLGRILPGCWENTGATAHFAPAPGWAVDVYEVQRLAGADAWQGAAGWLLGEFLEGVALAGNLEAESWLQGERERWRQYAEQILLWAAQAWQAEGNLPEARQALARLLRLSPWYEMAHREMMLLLAGQGQLRAALRQYGLCREALARELGVAPSAATERVYRQIEQAADARPAGPVYGRWSRPVGLRA